MSFYPSYVRPLLFTIDPDIVHEFVTYTGYLLGRTKITRTLLRNLYYYEHPMLLTQVFNTSFINPIGIAGGFDKDCRLIQTLPAIGFGFTEVGSITAKPYSGNPRPWSVRLPAEKSIIVHYGLRNKGVDVLKQKIAQEHRYAPLIINIAKTNDPAIKGDGSIADYTESFIKLQPLADILNINISCPNTGDGQLFCENPELLDRLLKNIGQHTITKPVVVKLKPDLSDDLLDEIIDVVYHHPFVKGFVIANLTNNRSTLKKINPLTVAHLPGGLSGLPVKALSNAMIAKIYKKTKGKYPIIGLGGVFTAEDAYEKICLGASLVEIATGLIYGGPSVVKQINRGLVDLLIQDNFTTIAQAVGSKNRQ